jgi:iron complex transport system permease protein
MSPNKKLFNWFKSIFILLVLLILTTIISLCVGSANISLKKIFSLLFLRAQGMEYSILFDIRIPRIFLSIIIGGALSVAGVIFQGIFRNPLVEPYTLGVSGGAALSVALSVIFGLNIFLPVAGFLGALLSILLVYIISRNRGEVMLLVGVMISFISASAVMFIMAVAGTNELHSILFWIMGSLEDTNKQMLSIVSIFIFAGISMAVLLSQSLNALNLGEEGAMHLGVNVKSTRRVLFFIASLLTGLSVSMSGIIGFVGLVVPHFMRIFVGNDYRILTIVSFFAGGIFLMVCDTIARTVISPMELPVGVITGIAGGIIFIYFLIRRKKIC